MKPVFTEAHYFWFTRHPQSAAKVKKQARGRSRAHLVSDFSYHNLVTTVGPFTPTGYCVEIA
jgi:hypothetical protein